MCWRSCRAWASWAERSCPGSAQAERQQQAAAVQSAVAAQQSQQLTGRSSAQQRQKLTAAHSSSQQHAQQLTAAHSSMQQHAAVRSSAQQCAAHWRCHLLLAASSSCSNWIQPLASSCCLLQAPAAALPFTLAAVHACCCPTVSLCLSASLSLPLCLCLCLSVSVSDSLSLSLPLYLSVVHIAKLSIYFPSIWRA